MAERGRQCSGMDNFSRFPDELVLGIISLLPMKEAVRTSVLSTRWRCHINRFRLRSSCSKSWDGYVSRIQEWIITVMRHDIRELELSLDTKVLLLLPPSLFTCKTLVVLKLSVCPESGKDGSDELTLKVPGNVCLPSLKVLHLVGFTFSDDCRKRLFSNFPVLEDLKCSFKETDWKFDVCNPMLKRLSITSSENLVGKCEIVVDAPALHHLELSVSDVYSCTFLNAQALAKADVRFLCDEWEDYDETFTSATADLMKAISNIQTFRICGSTLFEFNYYDIPNPGFNNVTHLTIASCNQCGFAELQYILAGCESLETLVLEGCLDDEYWSPEVGIFPWASPQEEDEINCLSFCMKKIVILWFEGSEVEIELAKYFLQNAKVLECMEIHIRPKYQDQLEITEELLRLPRASNDCIVEIV